MSSKEIKEKSIGFTEKEIKKLIDLSDNKEFEQIKNILSSKLPKVRLLKYKDPNDIKPVYSDSKEAAEDFRKLLIEKQTESEKVFKALLKASNIKYEFQKIFWVKVKSKNVKKKFYIVDFYLPELETVIEIDGEYHDEVKQQKQDKFRTSVLLRNGILKVFRFSNEDVLNNHNYVLSRLNQIVTNTGIVRNKVYKKKQNKEIIDSFMKTRNHKKPRKERIRPK
jgi:very-short-patch-repair endonuclease